MKRRTSSFSGVRNDHRKRGQHDVDLLTLFIDAVKTSVRDGFTTRDVVAVIGKLFARSESRSFANDLISFDHELAAVGMRHDPFASEERYGLIRSVLDGNEIDERVRLVGRKRRPTMMVHEFIKSGGKTRKCARAARHPARRRGNCRAASG